MSSRATTRYAFPMIAMACAAVAACQLSPTTVPSTPANTSAAGTAAISTDSQGIPWVSTAPVSASAGGVVTSPDGKMKLSIPPGALDQDTTVKINWTDSSDAPIVPGDSTRTPGVMFNVDLGGARIQDGQSINVSAPVDLRFIVSLMLNDSAFNASKYGLQQVSQGNWQMTMPIRGADITPPPDVPPTAVAPYAQEVNLQRLPVVQTQVVDLTKVTDPSNNGYSIQSEDPYATAVQAIQNSLKSKYSVMCNVKNSDLAAGGAIWSPLVQWYMKGGPELVPGYGCFAPVLQQSDGMSCMICQVKGGQTDNCTALLACFGHTTGVAGCATPATPPPPPPPPPVGGVSTYTHWSSNDPLLNGQNAAPQAYMRFSPSTGYNGDMGINNAYAGANYVTTYYTTTGSGATLTYVPHQNYVTCTPHSYNPTINGSAQSCAVSAGGNTMNFTLTKNMPNVVFAGAAQQGSIANAQLQINTTVSGAAARSYTGPASSSTPNTVWGENVSIYPNPTSATLSISPNNYQSGNAWVDVMPRSAPSIMWNNSYTDWFSVWYSSTVKATLNYQSDDASVPADQIPASLWNTQSVTSADVKFNHVVSSAASKPASRDVLAFTGVNGTTPACWGINGANGIVNATRVCPAVTFTGGASYKISQTVGILMAANLPHFQFTPSGLPAAGTATMQYTLDGSTTMMKTMVLPVSNGTPVNFKIPIEDGVNNAVNHTFQIFRIDVVAGGNTYALAIPGSNARFPNYINEHRNSALIDIGTLASNAELGKYQIQSHH